MYRSAAQRGEGVKGVRGAPMAPERTPRRRPTAPLATRGSDQEMRSCVNAEAHVHGTGVGGHRHPSGLAAAGGGASIKAALPAG